MVKFNLKEQGTPTAEHYTMLLHIQEYFVYLGCKREDFPISDEILSLSMNSYLSDGKIAYIVSALN